MAVLGIVIIIVLLLILLLIFSQSSHFFTSSSHLPLPIKTDDIERPLVQEDSDQLLDQRNEAVDDNTLGGSHLQTEGNVRSPAARSISCEQRISPHAPNLTEVEWSSHSEFSHHPDGSLILDIGEERDDLLLGQTLRRPVSTSQFIEEEKYTIKDGPNKNSRLRPLCAPKEILDQGTCLFLEVITGPARGLQCSVWSSDVSKHPLTLGRVPPSDILLKDSEVSGKHAMINWNPNKLKWELVDMGSLNGTLLNAKAINHPDTGSRTWGEPKELVTGDAITLGTTTQINVQITSLTEVEVPYGVGIASDPMSTRLGGKRLPMEDVCYYRLPLPGVEQFGLFGICDGHGGAAAAQIVSKILPEMVATILLDTLTRDKVLSRQDATDVLHQAFSQTEARLNHDYEGCTATLLLVWGDGYNCFFAQCANVGDSACILNVDGLQIKMTEDHRITSYSEKQRFKETGNPSKDGETRLLGLNLGRMLGDKFLKQQDARFSSEPYISQVVRINQDSKAFAVLASDGLWDVVSAKKASQLVLQEKERYSSDKKDSAQKTANFLLNEARKLRTKDNTSIVYVDCDTAFRRG